MIELLWIQTFIAYAIISVILYRWKTRLDRDRLIAPASSNIIRQSLIALVIIAVWFVFAVPIIKTLFLCFDVISRLI